jgi:aminopeptidase N
MIIVSEERAMQTLNSNLGEANEFRSNAHELAHFWWMIADAASPDDWINEGLAEYTAFRLTSDRFGEAFASARIDEYRHNVTSRRAHESIAETPGDSPDREANRYDRATLMMLEAERRFGREAVDRFLRHLYSEHAQTRQATTEEFLREVRQELGRSGEDYFREALYAHD